MLSLFEFLRDNPFLLLFVTLALSVWIGRFSVKGELAKSAVAIGCSARPTRILSRISASSEKSRFTCTVQVRNIMSRPCVPTFGM